VLHNLSVGGTTQFMCRTVL